MNEKVPRLLKNYRSYRYAVNNGIAPHQSDDTLGMPMALDFGPRAPAGLQGRGSTLASFRDYQAYDRVVKAIDGAVADVLNDEEQNVIRYKYIERNTLTLALIAEKFNMSERRALYLHKKALKSLALALAFVDEPEIINIDNLKKVKNNRIVDSLQVFCN